MNRPLAPLGINLCGAEFGAHSLPGLFGKDYTYPTARELAYYRDRGLSLVRFPFRWERVQRQLFAPLDPTEMARMDAFVAAAGRHDMGVILSPHNFARYHGAVIGTPAVPHAAFEDFWRRLASHYRDQPAVHAYNLVNEPHDTGGLWPAAAQAGVDGIRAADRARPILVPGEQYTNAEFWRKVNEALWVHDPAGNLAYEVHVYFDHDHSGAYKRPFDPRTNSPLIGVERMHGFVEWLRVRNARGFVGEAGIPDDDPRWLEHLHLFLTFCARESLPVCAWAGGPWWKAYRLSLEPTKAGEDKPAMRLLAHHAARRRAGV